MPQCGKVPSLTLFLSATVLLSAATREADEQCILAIKESLIDLEDSPRVQLRQAFQVIARSQLYGRPLQIQEHLEKRAYDILSAIDQCGAGTPAVPCLLDPTLPAPPRNRRIFIASNLHNNAALMPHYITQLLLSVVSLTPEATFVSLYESGSTDATGMLSFTPTSLDMQHPLQLSRHLACGYHHQEFTPVPVHCRGMAAVDGHHTGVARGAQADSHRHGLPTP